MKHYVFLYMLLFSLSSCTEKQKDRIVKTVDDALDVVDDTFFDGTDHDEVIHHA